MNPTQTIALSQQTALSAHAHAGLRFVLFRSIDAAGTDWDAAAPPDNLFLQRDYLRTLEHFPPVGMLFCYLVYYKEDAPVGVSICQIKHFSADSNIREENGNTEKAPCFFDAVGNWMKKRLAAKIAGDILISGNMLLSGEHGYWFKPGTFDAKQTSEILEASWTNAIQLLEKDGARIPVILLKDLTAENREQGNALKSKGFVEFEIQPSMVMDLPFGSFDAYLEAMSTKYRTRAKRAFKKMEGIVRKELSLAEIQKELPRIYHLYLEIARNAGFNMVDLNEEYLPALKKHMPEQFRLYAYYDGDDLVAFYTTIRNYHELEAHFLGYHQAMNHDKQLYINILYDIIREGIEAQSHRIVFARTALEIKSSVGAVPTNLYCYLRHQNNLANKLTGTALDYFKPVEQWQQRHPFKD